MSSIEIKVEGLDKLIEKLGKATAFETLEKPMYRGGVVFADWSRENRLMGPRPSVLDRVTSRLWRSITTSKPIRNGNEMSVKVGTNVEYAKIHEYGFNGIVQVPAHMRKVFRKVSFSQVNVKPGALYVTESIGSKKIRGGDIFVSGHSRRVNLRARPFLGPSLEQQGNIDKATKYINEAIQKELSK